MAKIHSDRLDELVTEVNKWSGDFRNPSFVEKFLPIELEYSTHVDDIGLSPYSEEYFRQQIALYEEVSGRKLNQADGELHPVDIEGLLAAPNPIGILDVGQMAEHVRSISTMLSLAGLTGQAEVLDMGAGHGIASEVMAFMACKVHAIDIDPVLSELSSRRAALRGLHIERSILNFDDLSTVDAGRYDGAFFSQSLHHCLRPWELIENLKTKIKLEGGVIAFVGEPINDYWWKNWGLRLDEISLFVARSHGWFESGWTLDFITDCFERNGFTLDMFKGGFSGGDIGVATTTTARREVVLAKAAEIGLTCNRPISMADGEIAINAKQYMTLIGEQGRLHGQPAFRQQDGRLGALIYGPYITLGPGEYEFATLIEVTTLPGQDDALHLDVATDLGREVVHANRVSATNATKPSFVTGRFTLANKTDGIEIRVIVERGTGWIASLPTLRRL